MEALCKKRKYLPKGMMYVLLLCLSGALQAQAPATVPTPVSIGRNCGGGSSSDNYKVFNYNGKTNILSSIMASCRPSLASPGFNPYGGSITFNPVDQNLYYIETTSGNNSIIWRWPPNTCPTGSLAPVYTFANTFIVGLEYNTLTGTGYQLEFSTSGAPYTIYLRQITNFSPLVAGASQQINLPAGVNIWQQNGDIVITPTGKMYFVLDNKMFSLDYTTYGSGTLNANYIDTLKVGSGNYTIGLSFAYGKFVASVQGNSCDYQEIDISTGKAVLTPVSLSSGTYSATDMGTLITGIGASKKVSTVNAAGNGQVTVKYDVKIKNYGNVNLTNVQLMDSVAKVFGSSFVSAGIAAVGSLPSGLTLNPSYDGKTDARIFAAGGTMVSSPPDSAIVRITVQLNNPLMNVIYYNSAIASATGTLFSNNVSDSSMNSPALIPDPNGNEVPDDPGEGVPTPLLLSNWVILANTISDFNGVANSQGNYLHWTIQNQSKAGQTSMQVQRSSDGVSFGTIAQPSQQGEGSQAYHWLDAQPLTGTNFYRIKMVLPDGESAFSETVALNNNKVLTDLIVSPNPFHQTINFSLTLQTPGRIGYRLIDLTSRTVRSGQLYGQAGTNLATVENLDGVPAGTYVLEVLAGNQHFVKKLIKVK